MKRSRGNYWKDLWNYVELLIICLSWVAMAMFLVREVVGRVVMRMITEDKSE